MIFFADHIQRFPGGGGGGGVAIFAFCQSRALRWLVGTNQVSGSGVFGGVTWRFFSSRRGGS